MTRFSKKLNLTILAVLLVLIGSLAAADPKPAKIGQYIVKPISNKLYVENCKNSEYKYNPLAPPSLKNPSENIFTDVFNDLTDPATEFMKAGTYVSFSKFRNFQILTKN